jgi:hypothetical protein
MRVFFNISLALILLISQVGVSLHYHYCPMMKQSTVSINDIMPVSSCCKDVSNSCCKHTYKYIQLKDNFFGSSLLKVEKTNIDFSFISFAPIINFYGSGFVKHQFTDSSPPPLLKCPVFLRNRALLI